MAGYIAWEELEVEPAASVEPGLAGAAPEDPAEVARHERLAKLMSERARLEKELMRLLGKAPADPEEERDKARFPMPIHSAESRLEDRRLAQAEERASAAARRSLERIRLRLDGERQRADAKREQEGARLSAASLERSGERLRSERHQDWVRGLLAQQAIQRRWDEQRRLALVERSDARRSEQQRFDERSTERRERALERRAERREEERAVAERLDRRHEKPSTSAD
ncbi:MAG TPA: hypothetical protein VMG12_00230 [Polyangiaceae bacterium]|nr:hypothetical protein [Polyangiaceae bacterium]